MSERELDKGIERWVRELQASGIATIESCEGGVGHAFPEPTIVFRGNTAEGFKVLSFAMFRAWPVACLRQAWNIIETVPNGPYWELVFWRKDAEQETENHSPASTPSAGETPQSVLGAASQQTAPERSEDSSEALTRKGK